MYSNIKCGNTRGAGRQGDDPGRAAGTEASPAQAQILIRMVYTHSTCIEISRTWVDWERDHESVISQRRRQEASGGVSSHHNTNKGEDDAPDERARVGGRPWHSLHRGTGRRTPTGGGGGDFGHLAVSSTSATARAFARALALALAPLGAAVTLALTAAVRLQTHYHFPTVLDAALRVGCVS